MLRKHLNIHRVNIHETNTKMCVSVLSLYDNANVCARWAEERERHHLLLFVQPTYCHCLHLLAILTSETILRKHELLFFYLLSVRCTKNAAQMNSLRDAGTDLHLDVPPRPPESRARPSHSPSSPEL